jgi:uridine kinase
MSVAQMTPFFIGIAGPSCSGKSEVSRRLSRILRAPVIALDRYYRDLKFVPFEQRAKTNFDCPEALDHDLLLAHARQLKQGYPIEEPCYDFADHVRTEETTHIEPADFLILDGLFALHWPDLRELLNARIYITADHDVCLARRIYRDLRERGRTEDSVRRQYEATVRPMCDCYVVPSQQYADVVLSGTQPVKQSVRTLLDYISGRIERACLKQAERDEIAP